MCGIFGWCSGKNEINRKKAVYLTNLMAHRGPDSSGYYYKPNIFLGHRRLKIIDLTDQAHQPFTDSSGRYTIVFNGEIYNYLELKEEISSSRELMPMAFRSASDTEVLLFAYILWGKEFLQRIEGMFAFAIFDANNNTIFLGRDHLGQKPLYYSHQNGILVFASELRSLIEHPQLLKKINVKNILQFHAYDSFPYENTPFQAIYKLLPGHCLEYNIEADWLEKKCYWDSVPDSSHAVSYSFPDALEILDSLLTDSLNKHLRSDVPFGVFLSGGVDSSLLTYYAKKILKNAPLHTFSVGVHYSNFNESNLAKIVSEKLNTAYKEFELHENDMRYSMDKILNHIDEPLADPGLINSYFIASKACEHIKVALAGDGGDELFAGYASFQAVNWMFKMRLIPKQFFSPLLFIIKHLLQNKNAYMSPYFKLKQFIQGLDCKDLLRLPCWLAASPAAEIKKFTPGSIPVKT